MRLDRRAVVGEIKKERYLYYHCSGYPDKRQGNPASRRRKYVREEALEVQFTELLGFPVMGAYSPIEVGPPLALPALRAQ